MSDPFDSQRGGLLVAAARARKDKDRVRELTRQRGAELGTEIRSRYETAARQLSGATTHVRELARERGAGLGTGIRSRYETTVRQRTRG